jgi:hypothetical protein
VKLFQIQHLMEAQKTPEAKRAFLSGLYYAASQIQGYATELWLADQHYNEVPAERLRTLAGELITLGTQVLKEAQELEKAEEEARRAELKSMTCPPPTLSEQDRLREQFEERIQTKPTKCHICGKDDPPCDGEVYLMNGNGGAYGVDPAHAACIAQAVEDEPDRETRGWYPKTS